MIRSACWNNVIDSITVECRTDQETDPEDGVLEEINVDWLPYWLNNYLKPIVGNIDFHIVIEYLCTGFYGPGDCYPYEGIDDRNFNNVTIRFTKPDSQIRVPDEIAKKIFFHYEDRVKHKELPDSIHDDGYEHPREYDYPEIS